MLRPSKMPKLLYAAKDGSYFDHEYLEAMGRSGGENIRLNPNDFIELPEGSEIFLLQGHSAVGFNQKKNKVETLSNYSAVSAFIAPAHTQTFLAASAKQQNSVILPLYAYSAVGYADDKLWVTALRIDPDIRQDCNQFNQKIVKKNLAILKSKFPDNRLLDHIAHCATSYFCPAARNFFHYRWEAPLPTSPSCNSMCVGCISQQPKDSGFVSPQNRITFVPTSQEIAELAVFHINHAPNPIVSFGQGCEGEPLNVFETILEAIKIIRSKTKKGIINLNTNGSNPKAVGKLVEVGLDSMRISLNSAQKELYNLYHRPINYVFDDLAHSCRIARNQKKWVSLNYFVFPGISDSQAEFNALCEFITQNNPSMIQWRNFNIDPILYYDLAKKFASNSMGVANMIGKIKKKFPNLYNGYFNPGEEIIKK